MSRIRVTSRGGGRSLNIFQYATAESVDKLHLAVAKRVENKVGEELRNAYRHTIREIGQALSLRMPYSIGVTGTKRISYERLNGRSGRINTETWYALSDRYLGIEPAPAHWKLKNPGTPFWQNEDELATAYWEGTGAHLGTFAVKVKKKNSAVPSRTHHKDRFRIKSVWSFQKLPDRYLDELIRGPFVTGDETASPERIGSFSASGTPTWKAWVQEKGRKRSGTRTPPYKDGMGRPWMARMAATLGRDMRTLIRKL